VARDAIDLADLVADEEVREVERVRAEVAERAGARRVGVHPPRPRRLGVDQPVLEVPPTNLSDLAEFAVFDQPLRVPDRGDEPIVERGAGGHVGVGRGVAHRRGLVEGRRGASHREPETPASRAAIDGSRVNVVRAEVVEHVHLVERVLPVGRGARIRTAPRRPRAPPRRARRGCARSMSGASGKNIGSRASAFACALPMKRYPSTPIRSGCCVIGLSSAYSAQ